jgi:hypothetical protein
LFVGLEKVVLGGGICTFVAVIATFAVVVVIATLVAVVAKFSALATAL